MKKLTLLLQVIILILLILPISVYAGSKVEIVKDAVVKKERMFWTINGTIKNISGKRLTVVRIKVPICDTNNTDVKITEATDMTRGLDPGQSWRYNLIITASEWKICPNAHDEDIITAY